MWTGVEKRLWSMWAEPRESGDSLFLQRSLFVYLQTQVTWPQGVQTCWSVTHRHKPPPHPTSQLTVSTAAKLLPLTWFVSQNGDGGGSALTDADALDLHTGRLQSALAAAITSTQTGFVNAGGRVFASRFTFIKSCCACFRGSLGHGPPVPPSVASLLLTAD